jgi:glycosyltransferase involved in cell wall biosynthesis
MATEARQVLAPVRHPVGGIRSFIRYVYPTLIEAGYRFTILGPAHSLFDEFQAELDGWEGVEFRAAPVAGKQWRARGLMRLLLRTRRYSLIHSHGLNAGVDAAIANFGIGVPHVLSSHGLVPPGTFQGVKGALQRIVMGVVLRGVDKVVAESNDARDNHLEHFACLRRPGRTVTIFNGIVPPSSNGRPQADNEDLRGRLGLDDGTFLIGFFGRFMPEKGFPVLVEALQRIVEQEPSRPLHVVTTGADDYVREYKLDIAERPELARRITFLGQVPDLTPVLQQVDLVVMPSLWEACPLLPMEAMTLGVPVLGSDCMGLREVLRGTPSVMVPSNDPSALAEGIVQAMTNPWKEVANTYAQTARSRFDVRRTAEQLYSLFDELVSRGKRGASPRRRRATREGLVSTRNS